ncbi:transcription factor 21 [Venturia canescens]|uniref:transcription factor 21 n=1 Tax=Venturia canescens TaxID=32260 RepID=UPI001C9C9811|nr:transcription factor 21-like [Venturia canescens]
MPKKRRASVNSLDDEDFELDDKYRKDDTETRAPRNAANARERARMRVLSKAFCRLKTTLPWVPADTKLSKLDTLRLAATYIAHLRAVLREDGETHPDSTRSLSLALSWPFAIQGASAPMLNNSCGVSSSSSSSSPNHHYQGQNQLEGSDDIKNYSHSSHQHLSTCHDSHQLSYY